MIYKESEGLRWIEFELLADFPIRQASFTRHGGVSLKDYESLNLSFNVGDDKDLVQSNCNKVMNLFSITDFARAKLCHGDIVAPITSFETPLSDGLITQTKNLTLFVSHADCQAAIFYDPVNHVIANVHCGWRGSVLNIYEKTVIQMKYTFHSKPENLFVAISPILGKEYIVFINYKKELPETFLDFQITPFHFDFWRISEWQLKKIGVLGHHIQIAEIDTFNSKDFFSFRHKNRCGRQATLCSLL